MDRTPFNDELRAARADADKFQREGIKAQVDADTTKAKAKTDELSKRKVKVPAEVDLSTKAAEAKLAALKKTAGGKFAESLSNAPAWLGPALAALPAAVTLLGTAAGAATAVGATVATGGIALAAYGAVAKGVLAQAATAAKAVAAAQEKYNVAVETGTKRATAYAAEQKAILLAYHGMSPAQVALSKELGDLSKEWSGVQKSLTPVIAMSVAPWLGGITSGLKDVKLAVTDVSQVVGSLGHDFDAIVNSPSFATFAKFIGGEGSQVVNAGGGAILNFFQGFITLLPQFRPLIGDVDQGITRLGTSFLAWAQSDSARHDIQEFMSWLHDNGPLVGHLLLSIGGALKNLGSGLLGPAGGAEIRLLTGFFNLIAHLPPSFVQPVSDLAASLLLISRFGFGRKILSVGVNFVGSAAAKLFNLLTPGGSLDFTGKFSADAGMQRAADTMVGAAADMQKAADTMVGAGAEGNGVAGAGGAAGAQGAAGAEGAAGAAGAGAAEGGAARAGLGATGIIAALTPVLNFAGAGAFAIYALSSAFDNVTGKAGKFIATQAAADKATGTNIAGYEKLAAQLRKILPGGSGGLTAGESAGLMKALGVDNLRGAGTEIAALAAVEKKASSMAAALAQEAFARATRNLTTAIAAGQGTRGQFARDLTAASTGGGEARRLVDEYTLAIQRNGTGTAGAAEIRARMVSDFERQGLNARQANDLVDTYTQGVLRNGDTTAAKRAARAQLIQDFIDAGDTAKQAAAKVDTLIGQISDIHSKSVSLSVKASGSFTITGQSVSAGAGHKIIGGVAAGGLMRGPGGPTTDSIPAWLSNGEYVIKAASVAKYGPKMFDRLNAMQLAGGGLAGSYSGTPPGLGAFDRREWAATQSLLESADAAAAVAALKKDIASVRATMMGGLGTARGGGAAIVKYAESFLGVPYVWGGTTPAGWDCSGAVRFWLDHFGIPAPRTSQEQQLWATPSADQAGALVFFYGTGGTASHVGLSTGRGTMVNAANPALGTLMSSTAGNTGFGVPPDPLKGRGTRLSPRIFDSGGYLPPGLSLVRNNTGRTEELRRVDRDSLHGGSGALMRDVHLMLPEGSTVASALRELTFRLRVAAQQGPGGTYP